MSKAMVFPPGLRQAKNKKKIIFVRLYFFVSLQNSEMVKISENSEKKIKTSIIESVPV